MGPMAKKKEYLDQFNGKVNEVSKKKYWEDYLKKTKVKGRSMWDLGYRISIEHQQYALYWVYLVHP